MKKLFEEIELLINSPSTKSDSNFIADVFHLLIWGGQLLTTIFGLLMFVIFFVVLFKSDFNFDKCLPVFFISIGSLFASYILIKLRITLYSKE